MNHQKMNHQKINGAYYTPELLASFMINELIIGDNIQFKHVLEPSCGDGVFIKHLVDLNIPSLCLDAVEKNREELNKAQLHIRESNFKGINFFHENFLEFFRSKTKSYDLIIGNPPYVNSKHMEIQDIETSKMIFEQAGLDPKGMKNIWTAFVLASLHLLSPQGVLSLVLPAEILNVKYSGELRTYLSSYFEYTRIYSFNELIFPQIQQDVILFTGYRKSTIKGTNYRVINNIEQPSRDHIEIHHPIDPEVAQNTKWNNFFLTSIENRLVQSTRERLQKVDDFCVSSAGIVTAANNYFVVNRETLNEYNLNEYSNFIILKGGNIPNCVNFTQVDKDITEVSGKPCNLLLLEKELSHYSDTVIRYIKHGESNEIHKKYKCSKRSPWYKVPSVWTSEGIFFRRIHKMPRFIVNKSNALVADSAYRINMRGQYQIESLAFCFYNSITLAFAELEGRYYGSGLLELTPNEFKNLPIPYFPITNEQFSRLDELVRSGVEIEQITDYTDEILLHQNMRMNREEVELFKEIRRKLVRRRLKITNTSEQVEVV